MKKRILSMLLVVCMVLGLMPTTGLAAETAGTFGAFNVSYDGTTPTYASNTLTLGSGTYTIGGTTTTDKIVVSSGAAANITLNGVSIDVSGADNGFACAFDMTGATVNLTLIGTNALKSGNWAAGLRVPTGASLTITAASTGSLNALSVSDSSKGVAGAGIGGSANQGCGTVIINGGTVTATGGITQGGNSGAGIGGGGSTSGDGNDYVRGGTVTITGGFVTATGNTNSAGIGGGGNYFIGGAGGTVNISGGTVIATGGSWGGAGIGGGRGLASGTGATVTITGGSVKATGGGSGAAAIGAGAANDKAGTNHGTLKNGSGANVTLYTFTIADAKNTTVTNLATTPTLGYDYGTADMKTDGEGKLYVYLPSGKTKALATAGSYTYAGSIVGNAANLATVYPVSGTVNAGTTGANVSGLTVNLYEYTDTAFTTSVGSATTNVSGAYTIYAPNGSYVARVAASGSYAASVSGTITVSGNAVGGANIALSRAPYTGTNASTPELTSKTDTQVVLGTVSVSGQTVEYGKNTVNAAPSEWQTATTFAGLEPNTLYYFFARVKQAGAFEVGDASAPLSVTTKYAAPAAPSLEFGSIVANSVTLTTVTGAEYSKDNGVTWQDSNTFPGLSPATQYTFVIRIKETVDTVAGTTASQAQYTAAATPSADMGYSVNYATERITVANDYEVSTDAGFDSGTALANDATLTAGNTYYVRVAATSSVPASEAVSFTIPGRPAAPTTVITSDKTRNSITITTVSGQEYKIGDGTWQDSGSFADLSANTEYIVYARVKATGSTFASEAYSTTIKTKPDGSLGFALPTITVSPTYDPGKTLNDIPIPTDWAWSEPTTVPTVTISGYVAIYTPTDTDTVDYSGVTGYQIDGSGKVAITCTVPLTVNPASPKAADFTYTAPGPLIYDGTLKTAAVAVKSGISGMGAFTVKYYKDGVITDPINTGTYTVKIDLALGENYTAATDITNSPWTFTIDKATITNHLVSQAGTLTYNGSPQTALVTKAPTTAVSETAIYQYCITEDGTYSDTIPALTEAGAYTVYYKVTADNHNDESGNFTITIASLDLSNLADSDIVVNPDTVVYTGEAWQPSVTVKSGSDTIPAEDFVVSYGNNTDAGDVTVTVAAITSNSTNVKSVTRSITQAELRAEMFSFSAGSALAYDGTAKPAIVTAIANGTYAAPTGDIAIYYELKTGDSGYGSRVTTAPTSAGTYRVSIDVSASGNYQGTTNLTSAGWNFTIAKAPISFNVSNNNYTYDANPHMATVAQAADKTPVIASDKFTVTYDGSGKAYKTDVGIYDVVVTLSDDNFCFVGESDPTVRSRKVGELTIKKSMVTALWKNTTAVYSGTVKSPDFVLIGLKSGDEENVTTRLSGSVTNAGTYTVTAELTGAKAGNYNLTNPVGTFIIQKVPVAFTLASDTVQYDGNGHMAIATAEPDVSNVITYRNSKGEIVVAPTNSGSYYVCAEITDSNYRHADGTDGSARKIGVLTIYQNNAPATYTANFDANGGFGSTTALSAVQPGTVRILPVNNFVNAGKTFAGWQYSGKTYQSGENFVQPSVNVTFKALWNEKVYSIGGIVQEGEPAFDVPNVVVTLMLGSKQIGQTVTNAEGKYSFADVAPGVYNLVANKDGVTQTILVIVADKNVADQNITMPTRKLNSVVEVKAGSPAIVIGNLDKAFTEQDETDAQTQMVELKLTAETKALDRKDLPQQEIQKKSGNINLFLDMTLTKKIGNTEITLLNSPVLLTAVITLPAELQGKDSYIVYRYHGTEVQTLTTTQNAEGEKIEISKDKTTLTVYTKNFSVYAIKGTIYSGGGGSGGSVSVYKLSFDVNGGSSIAMFSGAPDATVDLSLYRPVREGYNFAGWYTDEKLTNSITSLKLTANTTVYAKWTEKGAMPFADVPSNSYYYDAVLWALDKRITSGANPVTFAPGGICTRAQAVTFLWRAMGSPEPTRTKSPFADVKADAYYYKAVLWATENSITKGTSDSTFSPNRTVTRSQTMTFLWRAAGNPASDGPNHFGDVRADAYYADAVLWAIEEGITSGTSTKTFGPLEDCSRAQIVTFLYRYIGK